jgi:hypothetical protein
MSRRPMFFSLVAAAGCGLAAARSAEIEFTLQTRDPVTDKIVLATEKVDSTRVGVIAVDVWNFHWCKTAAMRIDAIVPRLNEALAGARALGMTVMLCPSDVVDNYVGYPQRESVLALPKYPVPVVVNVTYPPASLAGGCACGRERCGVTYGWDAMHPDLRIADADLMPNTQAEVYAICKKYGLTHLIYVGFHTEVCLLGKPTGLRAMKSAGLHCLLARDMTDAHPCYDQARNLAPDLNTGRVVAFFEKYLAPTISFQDELTKLGKWDTNRVIDPVRIAPWGTRMRPHLFELPITVTLTAPLEPGSEIRFTLDGSAPQSDSTLYTGPLVFTNTTLLRTSAFRNGRPVCLESEGHFVLLGPRPPLPDIYLGDLTPVRNVGFGHTTPRGVHYSGNTQPPQKDRSNLGQKLKIDRRIFPRGLGVHAPGELAYEIKPEYRRFVALAGADENLVSVSKGANLGRYPSVVFKIFIDGRQAAASPVMRVLSPAWRFDVEIPAGARMINVVAMDAGDGSREDFADWANAGFIIQR